MQCNTVIAWEEHLKSLNISKDYEVRVATEAALLAGLLAQGVPRGLGILSDDAGQLNLLDHALCWIHEVRPLTEQNRKKTEFILDRFWRLYQELKIIKRLHPKTKRKFLKKNLMLYSKLKQCAALLTEHFR